jgi:hypothetical protein
MILCAHCFEPLNRRARNQRYHPDCAALVKLQTAREWHRARAAEKRTRRSSPSEFHSQPVADGFYDAFTRGPGGRIVKRRKPR